MQNVYVPYDNEFLEEEKTEVASQPVIVPKNSKNIFVPSGLIYKSSGKAS